MSETNKTSQEGGKESLSTVMKNTSTRRVVTGGTIYVILDIISSLFFTAYNMMLDRTLVEVEKDMLVVVTSYLLMLKTFALLGFVGAGAQFVSEYMERDMKEARKYGQSASKYNFLVIGLPIICSAIVIFIFKSMENDPLTTQVYFILIFVVLFDRLRSCPDIYLVAYQRYDLYGVSYHLSSGVMYTLALFTLPFGPLGTMYSFLIGYVLMFALSVSFVKRISDFPVSDVFAWRKEHGLFTKMFKFNLLFSLANLIYALLTTTLFITMGDFLGFISPGERVALGLISTFSNILLNVFNIVAGIQPAISQAFALKNKKLMSNYFLASLKFPFLMSVAVIAFYMLFGEEMIAIFFPNQDVRLGLLIMVFLMPSYAVVAFASRYDNILAGIGRPETAIVPWVVGLGVAIVGFLMTFWFVPTGLQFFGFSARFITGLISMVAGMFIAGITIVWIAVKVLGIKIPREYIARPIAAALATAAVIIPVKLFLPIKSMIGALLGEDAGGIVYTVIMVLGGVLLYLTFCILLGAINRSDGRFWKSVIGTLKGIGALLIPLFKYARFLLAHVPRRLKVAEYEWVTSTKKGEMEKGKEFTIADDFQERYGEKIPANRVVEFSVKLTDIKSPFYHVTVYPKIDMRRIDEGTVYVDKIESDTVVPIKFSLPAEFAPGHHELYIDVEMFTAPKPGVDADHMKHRAWLTRAFDFSYAWFDEKIRYVTIE
jgi:O-antigen/teichoic acid export membrane protein